MLRNKEQLLGRKNLLAFSAGVDSTALLHLLLENNILFDIAIVDYGVRQESQDEVKYAQALAQQHNLICHLHKARKIDKNFEATARELRYRFFESLIQQFDYTNLLTAHHLGDRFEWMMMQFCKGAGCYELSGMRGVEDRGSYFLIRPLLHLDKQELLQYLQTRNIKYFEDASNSEMHYKRNEFRHTFTQPLLKKHLSGIKKSFEYIDTDCDILVENIEVLTINKLAYFKPSNNWRSNIVTIDKYIKSSGNVITAQERELLKSQTSTVLGRKYIVSQMPTLTLIAPYIKPQSTVMDKKFKEKMRLLKIDPKLRAYLSTDSEAVELLSTLL
ncbi:MAG: tRNA lysidine(34) synthetase TilS [Campylobacterales bacterium]|nr:tRNA lysidine(34) synthetase TilS [Campylobacterales bacterium]